MESYHRGSDTERMMMISKVADAMHTSFDVRLLNWKESAVDLFYRLTLVIKRLKLQEINSHHISHFCDAYSFKNCIFTTILKSSFLQKYSLTSYEYPMVTTSFVVNLFTP